MAEMPGFDARRYWDGIYARSSVDVQDQPGPQERAIVSVLRDLAGDGSALELAVGAGRIAIPLAASGIEVDGIDFSPNAIELIRAHPDGAAVNAGIRLAAPLVTISSRLDRVALREGRSRVFKARGFVGSGPREGLRSIV